MSMSHAATPVGGRIMTRPFKVLSVLAGIAAVLLAWRFMFGLGAVTGLNDGYPWGLWIAFDVVIGTAIACGGYAIALMVYIMNRGKYHPLIRSALVTSALGYTLAGFSVVIDLGRWWNVYGVPLQFWHWNLNSILLEVALCIMLYMLVLWIEVSPAFFERGQTSSNLRIRSFSTKALPRVNRALPWLIALGLVLPTMHQSSLGSLMMLAGPRLHELWLTPLLPLMFLVSCLAMGYAAVIMESTLSTRAFRRPSETPLLSRLGRPMALILIVFATIRVADLAMRGKLGMLLQPDRYSMLFLLEMSLVLIPAAMLLSSRRVRDAGFLFRAAALLIAGGALYRLSTFLFVFNPGAWSYFPSVAEIMITVGVVSAEIMGYIVIVKVFPILQGAPAPVARLVPVPAVEMPGQRPAPVAGD
jgi:Ni/Fe-hydrogenase subunit HybB-like protein